MNRPPYRLTLEAHAQPLLEGTDLEAMVALGESDFRHRIPAPLAQHLVQQGPELALWMLARETARIEPWASRPAVLEGLLLRALQEADRDGVVWTRLLDRLAESRDWSSIAEERAQGKRAHLPPVPSPRERAQGLIPWVEARRSAEEIEEMMGAFHSETVWALVAEHAHVLSPEQMKRLRERVAEPLSRNPHLERQAREGVVRDLVQEMVKASGTRTGSGYGRSRGQGEDYTRIQEIKKKLDLFAAEGLSPELQREMASIQVSSNQVGALARIHQVLLRDRSCSREVLTQIVERGGSRTRADAMLHPNADDELRDYVVFGKRDSEAARMAVASDQVKGKLQEPHLWAVLRSLDFLDDEKSRRIRKAQVLTHPASTSEIWRSIALPWNPREKETLLAVASHPGARHDLEFRELLKRSSRSEVWLKLLLDATAEDFVEILRTCLRGAGLAPTLQALREAQVPEGVRLPSALASQLLRAPEAQDRLFAMTLIARLGQSSPEMVPSPPSAGASPRR